MTQPQTGQDKSRFMRALPLIAILIVAAIGAFTLRDYLSFEALRDNREALIAFRDANYVATVGVFMLAYVVIVAFSLPGATVATLTAVATAAALSRTSLRRSNMLTAKDTTAGPSRNNRTSPAAPVATDPVR